MTIHLAGSEWVARTIFLEFKQRAQAEIDQVFDLIRI